MSTIEIPEDMVMEICLRLPVYSLVRFRCVSKSWHASIDDPRFIRMHYDQTLRKRSIKDIVILRDSKVYNDLNFDVSSFEKLKNPDPCPAPLDRILRGYLVGSCRGIFCIANYRRFTLWNPSTGEYRDDIGCGVKFYPSNFVFGYDHVNDDFKLLSLEDYKCENSSAYNIGRFRLEVYSLRRDSSKTIRQGFPYLNCKNNSGVFVEGTNAIHWIVSTSSSIKMGFKFDGKNASITAFDLETQRFTLMPHPDLDDGYLMSNLADLCGCLCLCEWSCHHTNVWLMKDYGIKESWTKFISIEQCYYLKPLDYFDNGRQVFVEIINEQLCCHNHQEKFLKKSVALSSGPPNPYKSDLELMACLCPRSLVQLNPKNRKKIHGAMWI